MLIYRVFYKCQNCGAKFFEDYSRDAIIDIFGTFGKVILKNEKLLGRIFTSGKNHYCEVDTVGHGNAVGIRKIDE